MNNEIHPETRTIPVTCRCGFSTEIVTTMRIDSFAQDACPKCHNAYKTGGSNANQTSIAQENAEKFANRYKRNKTS